MADCRNLSRRLPDFSVILRGEAVFSQNFGNGTDTRVPQNVFLVFLIQFGLQRAAPFRIVSDTLVTPALDLPMHTIRVQFSGACEQSH